MNFLMQMASIAGVKPERIVTEKIIHIHECIEQETGERVSVIIGKWPSSTGDLIPAIGIMKADLSGWVEVTDKGQKTCWLSADKISEYLKQS